MVETRQSKFLFNPARLQPIPLITCQNIKNWVEKIIENLTDYSPHFMSLRVALHSWTDSQNVIF